MKNLLTGTASLVIINDVTQLDEEGRKWCVTIKGPAGGPYEGGNFRVEIKFGESYPREAPGLKVLTPIFHCNIHPQWIVWYVEGDKYEPGSVCMVSFCVIFYGLNNPTSHPKTFNQNTLDEGGWSVISSVVRLFDQLAALLASPNDQDPLNFLAGKMYKDDKEGYYRHAEHFTSLFAKPKCNQLRHDFTTAMALHLQQKGVQCINSISTTVEILQHHDVQYNFDAFDSYLDELTQQGKDSSGGQMSNNESEGGSNNEADDDVVYLGTVRPDDSHRPRQA